MSQPNIVKKITVKLNSATSSDKIQTLSINNIKLSNTNVKIRISTKEKKDVVKDSKRDMEETTNKITALEENLLEVTTTEAVEATSTGETAEDDLKTFEASPFYALHEKSAKELIIQFELDKYIPVNLDSVLNYFNISLRATDFKTVEEDPQIAQIVGERGSVLGAVKERNNRIVIYFKESDSIHRQRFTIAHELAHCCLNAQELSHAGNIEFRLDLENPKPESVEYKANVFAGELLMPKTVIDNIYENIPIPDVNDLAELFDVSVNVMENRLKYLGYKYKKGEEPLFDIKSLFNRMYFAT